MNKTYKVILVIVLLSIVVLVTGASYAYFKATITGDSETISIKAGKMGLTFDDGTSLVSLPNARPGDYITKDFNVENKSTVSSTYDYVYKYNIKLINVNVTFQEEDLEYTLEEYTSDTYEELKPGGVKESGFINAETITENNEMYIAARITRPPKGEKHYFRLTITFKNLEEVDQNYNQGATFSAKINIDDNKDPAFGSSDLELAIYLDGDELDTLPEDREYYYNGITCEDDPNATAEWDYVNLELDIKTKIPNRCSVNFISHSPTLSVRIKYLNGTSPELVVDDETDQHNLRYIGADADVNNYIWFNCDDYSAVTDAKTAAAQNCEKWRIIGLFKDIDVVDGESTTQQDLVKIIRDESIGRIAWDNKPYGTGSSENSSGSNNWADSRLMMLLNPGYENDPLMGSYKGSLYWNRKNGECAIAGAGNSNMIYDGESKECNLGAVGLQDGVTKDLIANIKWKLGESSFTSKTGEFYVNERGTETCQTTGYCKTERPIEWIGKIGLMYPSDYGYATGGGSKYDRQACLDYALHNWSNTGYKEDCAGNDWLFNGTTQWTLTPASTYKHIPVYVHSGGGTGTNGAAEADAVRPSLYLKSSVKIKSGEEDGSIDHPYILIP